MSFELYGKIRQFDDGHVPETIPEKATRIISYNTKINNDHIGANTNDFEPVSIQKPTVQVYNTALPVSLCQALYDETTKNDTPWGTYVTKDDAIGMLKEIPPWGSEGFQRTPENSATTKATIKSTQELATQAVAHFIFGNFNAPEHIINGDRLPPLATDSRIHGVQIWGLASLNGSCVPYHIDYAEYIRYTENVIVTPVVAGTVQCTKPMLENDMEGGVFAVNVGGLEHYRKFGYKGCLMKNLNDEEQRMGGWKLNNTKDMVFDMRSGWVSIPYRFNQGILHTGNLPHLSSRVGGLAAGRKRVIIGFNVFFRDIGQRVRQIPEHSIQFRKMVKFHRALAKMGLQRPTQTKAQEENKLRKEGTEGSCFGCIQIENVRKNKSLTKFLVLAKREKVKCQWRKTQMFMTDWIHEQLHDAGNDGLTVDKLFKKWEDESHHAGFVDALDILPSKDDILVHINHLVLEKDCKIKAFLEGRVHNHLLNSEMITRMHHLRF